MRSVLRNIILTHFYQQPIRCRIRPSTSTMKFLVIGSLMITLVLMFRIMDRTQAKRIRDTEAITIEIIISINCIGKIGHLINRCWYKFDKDFQPPNANNINQSQNISSATSPSLCSFSYTGSNQWTN